MDKTMTLQELTHKRNKLKMELALLEREIEQKRHEEWLQQHEAKQKREYENREAITKP